MHLAFSSCEFLKFRFTERCTRDLCISTLHHIKQGTEPGQQLLLDCVREAEERVCDYHHKCLSPEMRAKAIHEKLLSWQRLKGDVSSLTELLGSDMSAFRNEWSHLGPEVRELGVEIEAAIFEKIVDEVSSYRF